VTTRANEGPAGPTAGGRLAALIEGQADLFDEVGALAGDHRRALLEGDEDTLHDLAVRVETLAERFRMLEGERRRLGPAIDEDAVEDPQLGRARERLHRAVASVVRDRSVTAALLKRGAQHTEALSRAFGLALSGAYLPSGAPASPWHAGARLSKEA
jgi:hypothetical protein